MIPFHKTLARRLAFMAFLLAGLLMQAQLVFACGLMEGARQTQCCCVNNMERGCEKGGSCKADPESPKVSGQAKCCSIAMAGASDMATTLAVSQTTPLTPVTGPHPLPDIIFAAHPPTSSPPQTLATGLSRSYVTPGDTNIYIATRRIRI